MTGDQLSIDDAPTQTMCECGHPAIQHYSPHGRCVQNDFGCPCVSLVVVGSSVGKSSETLENPSIDADIAEPPHHDQLSIDDALANLVEAVDDRLAELSGGPGSVIPSRSTDPETSHAAAREIRVKAGSQRAYLLEAFALDWFPDATDEEAMKRTGGWVKPHSEFAKRCSELREGGFIEPTGETRTGAAGVERIVSRITGKGRAWVEANR